jgi:hypothetical protein
VIAYCQACPTRTHPFLDEFGLTHQVNSSGNTVCRLCTEARPCQGTVVAGTEGVRFAREPVDDKPRHRGLNRDGPVH